MSTSLTEYGSQAPPSLLFSQLSLRTTSTASKVIFKVCYNNDWKRIPQEREISYNDILHRCAKSFSLPPGSAYVLTHAPEDGHHA